jgi:hypothetical protein
MGLIHEKNQRPKVSCYCTFKGIMKICRIVSISHVCLGVWEHDNLKQEGCFIPCTTVLFIFPTDKFGLQLLVLHTVEVVHHLGETMRADTCYLEPPSFGCHTHVACSLPWQRLDQGGDVLGLLSPSPKNDFCPTAALRFKK